MSSIQAQPAPSTAARTLAESLRRRSDSSLAALLRARPDLAAPAPQDTAQLASRAATRSSVQRALDTLNRLELCVLDALVVAGQTTSDEVVTMVRADEGGVRAALDHLVDLALAWETPGGLRPLSAVGEQWRGGPDTGVSGVRPRAPEPLSAVEVADRLTEVSSKAQALLDHLDAHGGEGTSGRARRTVSPEDAATPVEELLARRLLLPRDEGTLVLPGEVALVLRGGRTTTARCDDLPALATSERAAELVERTAAGAAYETVRRVELLLDHWGVAPPAVLRAGGLAVRDLKATARDLHVDEPTAALLVEVAAEAGLLAEGIDTEGDPVWLPTDAFDLWSGASVAERWTTLTGAWLGSSRTPSLVGSRDTAGRAWNALAPELSSVLATESRRTALAQLTALPAGEVLATATGTPSLVARVRWLRPRRPAVRDDLVAAVLTEAAALGVMGAGGITAAGRCLLAGDLEGAAAAIGPHLPEPVDHVLLQADLTAVAPGPLDSAVARTLHLLAEVESRGGATVYRFTPASVRRAFDAGWSGQEVHDFVGGVSRTPVPQALSFLVDDVARTFGAVRVGHAEAFLRADDEAALAELLHHPGAASLGLRRLAPTVVISTAPLDVLLPRLRELGVAPVVEAPDGSVRVARPDQRRTRRPRRPAAGQAEARREAGLSAVVAALRAGDRAGESRPPRSVTTTPAGALAALREAIETGSSVVIGYVDNQGTATDRVVDPLSLEGGRLSAHDHRSDDTRSFAVHRITGVRPT